METSILTKDYKLRANMYELLKHLAMAIYDVSTMHNGYITHNAKLQLKYTCGYGRYTRIVTRLHDSLERLLVKHSIPYAIGNNAPRCGETRDYIEVSAFDLSELIQTLKAAVMLTKAQWSTLSLNARRNYIMSMYKLCGMSAGDLHILSQQLLADDCDNIIYTASHNPLTYDLYFVEVNTND